MCIRCYYKHSGLITTKDILCYNTQSNYVYSNGSKNLSNIVQDKPRQNETAFRVGQKGFTWTGFC